MYIFKTPETVNDPPRPVLPKSTRLKKGGMDCSVARIKN